MSPKLLFKQLNGSARNSPKWDISSATYWASASALIGGYLGIWLLVFHNIYGYLGDDRTCYYFGVPVTQNWRYAFNYYNIYHAYWFLVSYLPLDSKVSLTSYSLPGFGGSTGHYRFFLLYSVFLSASVLLVWAGVLLRVLDRRVTALVALWFLAISPTFVLWTPEPESRWYGFPFMAVAILLLFRTDMEQPNRAKGGRAFALYCFSAGTLIWIGQSVNYTVLYVLLPFCLVFWTNWFRRLRSCSSSWIGFLAFGVGLVWPQIVVELISHYAVGLPWSKGPLMGLVAHREMHATRWTVGVTTQFWIESFAGQLGLPLLALSVVGMYLYSRKSVASPGASRANRVVLILASVLALVYLVFGGSMAFFRQTVALQAFLFMFAAVAIVDIVGRISSSARPRFVFLVVACCVASAIPLTQSIRVLAAHQGLGRAVNWANRNKGSHKLETLRPWWYGDDTSLHTIEQLEWAQEGSWLLTYFPWDFLYARPSLLPYFVETQPLARWKTLWSTDSIHAELASYWTENDWRYEPAMSEARVYRISDILQKRMAGDPLRVLSVTASSVASDKTEAANVFDSDESPDGATAWVSRSVPGAHYLDITFSQSYNLGKLWMVMPGPPTGLGHISRLQVEAEDSSGRLVKVWAGDGLERYSLIVPTWRAMRTSRLRLVVSRHVLSGKTVNFTAIEEVGFPGFRVVPPKPRRPFADIDVAGISSGARELVITGNHFTPTTVLEVHGRRYPTEFHDPTRLTVPTDFAFEDSQAYLVDAFRRSPPLPLPRVIDIGSVAVDLEWLPYYPKANLFDGNTGTLWVSSESVIPHVVEFALRRIADIGEIKITSGPGTH